MVQLWIRGVRWFDIGGIQFATDYGTTGNATATASHRWLMRILSNVAIPAHATVVGGPLGGEGGVQTSNHQDLSGSSYQQRHPVVARIPA